MRFIPLHRYLNDKDLSIPYFFVQLSKGGQGSGEIWTSAILRVAREHLPDFGQCKSSAASSCASRCRIDPRVVGDLPKAINLK